MPDKTINYIKGNMGQLVSVEYVRNELAQLLQIDNLSFLIGAGCSSNIVEGKDRKV